MPAILMYGLVDGGRMKKQWLAVGYLALTCGSGMRADEAHHHADAKEKLGTVSFPISCSPQEQESVQRGLALLQDLAENTGGLYFTISDREDAGGVVAKAILAMRNHYLIAYHPAQPVQPGKWHRIRVKLDLAHTNVYARSGYYAE